MRVDVLQHVHFEGPGAIKIWAEKRNHQLIIHKLYEEDTIPPLQNIEFLIILGGPMSVNDKKPAWLEKERELIANLIQLNKPILGICLGAQQIAKALGSKVFQGEFREVGWFPIQKTTPQFSFIPDRMIAFHWHGEQFELPPHAERLFSSPACPNQAFLYNENVLGLQFHLETTKDILHLLIENDRHFIGQSKYVQTEQAMKHQAIPFQNKVVLFKLLDYIISAKK